MSEIEYKVMRMDEAKAMNAPAEYEGFYDDISRWDENWIRGVWRFEDGIPVELICTDGGEPEDQTLNRDWKFIPDALQKAYELGKSHA